jgi:hypothetical protein
LESELRTFNEIPTLTNFIEQIGQDVRLIYKIGCWTSLKRAAGKCYYDDDENTEHFTKGISSLTHINSADYLNFIHRVMEKSGDISWVSDDELPYTVMLYYSLFQKPIRKIGVSSIAEAMGRLKNYPLFMEEIKELTEYLLTTLQIKTFRIGQKNACQVGAVRLLFTQ